MWRHKRLNAVVDLPRTHLAVGPTCKSWKKPGPFLADRKTLPAVRVLIWSIRSVWYVCLNETNQIDETDQVDRPIHSAWPVLLVSSYRNYARSEG